MGIFKKDEVYDYTLLQKRGFLKVLEPKKSAAKVSKDGYFELGLEEISEKPSLPSPVGENPLSFFDNFSAPQNSNVNPLATFDNLGNTIGRSTGGDIKDLSVKLEDFEFKLARIADKLAMIESKINEFEEKVK